MQDIYVPSIGLYVHMQRVFTFKIINICYLDVWTDEAQWHEMKWNVQLIVFTVIMFRTLIQFSVFVNTFYIS